MTSRLDLTDRELEVLREIATGDSNQEIATRGYFAVETVKFHASNIYRKLGVENRCAAVWRALELGLIDPPGVERPKPVCPSCGRPYS